MPGFDALLDGYRRFRQTGWATQRARWSELADGQSPNTLVIACSDSRVDPSQIFDVSPGGPASPALASIDAAEPCDMARSVRTTPRA